MSALLRYALPAALALALAACGKKTEESAPLAFVPADTPYVVAALEPMPEAAIEDRFRLIQPLWKPYFAQIDKLLDEAAAKAKDDSERKALATVRGLLEEFRERDSVAKWKELGFTPQARSALYGVGLAPVLRLELADPAAFRAFVQRIEGKLGQPLEKGRVGEQDYWRLGPAQAPLGGVMTIEDKQLVVALVPKNASEATLKQLLGLERPSRSLADSGALDALAKERGYLRQGVGYIDTVRLFDLVAGEHRGSDAEFAAALELPATPIDAVCRGEIAGIAAHLPRLTLGYTQFDARHQSFAGSLDLDAKLLQQLGSVVVPVAGMEAKEPVLMDLALSTPVLKWKDFLSHQADAVAASPYQCPSLAKLNESFGEMKQGLDRTVPPPLSNFLGLRLTLERMTLSKDGMPEPGASVGRLLIATDNPMLLVSMAQLGAPPLKDLKLALDGKPVALPAAAMPMVPMPAYVAANNSAVALGLGNGAEAALPAYLAAPGGDGKRFMHLHITGEFYALYGQLVGAMMARGGGGEHQELIDLQRQMYERYRDWMASSDFDVRLGAHGVEFTQAIEFNPPK